MSLRGIVSHILIVLFMLSTTAAYSGSIVKSVDGILPNTIETDIYLLERTEQEWQESAKVPGGWKRISSLDGNEAAGTAGDILSLLTDDKNVLVVLFKNLNLGWKLILIDSFSYDYLTAQKIRPDKLLVISAEKGFLVGESRKRATLFYRWNSKEGYFDKFIKKN